MSHQTHQRRSFDAGLGKCNLIDASYNWHKAPVTGTTSGCVDCSSWYPPPPPRPNSPPPAPKRSPPPKSVPLPPGGCAVGNANCFCKHRAAGKYPDTATNCLNFYWCLSDGQAFYQACAAGTAFDFATQTCDWPLKTGCKGPVVPSPKPSPKPRPPNNAQS